MQNRDFSRNISSGCTLLLLRPARWPGLEPPHFGPVEQEHTLADPRALELPLSHVPANVPLGFAQDLRRLGDGDEVGGVHGRILADRGDAGYSLFPPTSQYTAADIAAARAASSSRTSAPDVRDAAVWRIDMGDTPGKG